MTRAVFTKFARFVFALALFAQLAPTAARAQLTGADAAAHTQEARAVMDATVREVLAVLRDDARALAQKRAAIEDIALARFDFRTMSRLVLKRDWRKFSEAERAAFVKHFRLYLAATYGHRISSYEQQRVELTGERLEVRGDVTVRTEIRGGEADGVQLDYRLRKQGGTWRIIDVLIEGISLVANFRSQFADVLTRGGPTELLRQLEEKNTAAAAAKTPE